MRRVTCSHSRSSSSRHLPLAGRATMAQQRRARLAVLLVVAAPLGASAWFGPTAIRQARWMAESRQVLPVVLARLASHPKFVAVKAGVSTGWHVLVYGQVAVGAGA